jgi:adenosylcobinamide amidohydrolase
MTTAATASIGGGVGPRRWVLNAQVDKDYGRHDLAEHGKELAALSGLSGAGVVMLTAADVRRVRTAHDGGVRVDATVGLTRPTWAAAPDEPVAGPGTINVVVQLPVRLDDGALLNALCTATEAKTQALLAAGVPGTGTASDAVTVVCPADGPVESFAGPRSVWGARLARAVHEAVQAGAAARDAEGYLA